ncbi:hypothetical protein Vadar_028843 [Vaccinium darrowii]|uniref:Uncharacterized protein n=1 Tax=Vaccinium darrowii TaxID=229202 RepID=A0ACB7XDL4_9ERIC|nr:hypothetical protein Vadar_028843 [Vaccinium darrowii]
MDVTAISCMDDDLSARFQSFSLTEEEQGEVILSQDDVVDSVAECQSSLFGKVISQKPPNLVGLRNTMEKVWGHPKNFRVLAVGNGIFQFIFPSDMEASRVLRGKPWFFNNNFLNLERWQSNKALKDYCFDFTPMYIQVWGLPLQFMSKDVGVKLGMKFGDVDDVRIPQSGTREGRFLRIRTTINVKQPLKRGSLIKLSDAAPSWVEFRYEKLPAFCRYCGKVGHEFLGCNQRFLDMEDEVFRIAQYGDWLRASPATQPGRRPSHHSPEAHAGNSNSDLESHDSSAKNQVSKGNKSQDEASLPNPQGKEDVQDSTRKPSNSTHEEMLTEAYLAEKAEKSVGLKSLSSPGLEGNLLTPYQEQILKNFAKPFSPNVIPSIMNTPPLSGPTQITNTPSPKLPSPLKSPNQNSTTTSPPTTQTIAPMFGQSKPIRPTNNFPTHSTPPPDNSPPEQNITLLSPNFPNPPSSKPPLPPPSLPTENLHQASLIKLCSPTQISKPTLVDIPISVAPPNQKIPKKRFVWALPQARGRRHVLKELDHNSQPPSLALPTPKLSLNHNGKRSLENLNPLANVVGKTSSCKDGAAQKKARSADMVASMAKDTNTAMVVETSLNWSPTDQ